jgi:hypothetical protein
MELWVPDSDGVEAADETEECDDGSLALGSMLTGLLKSGGFIIKVPSAGESECESEKEPPGVVVILVELNAISLLMSRRGGGGGLPNVEGGGRLRVARWR